MSLFEQLQPYSDILLDLDNTIYDERMYDYGAYYYICTNVIKLDPVTSAKAVQWLMQHKANKGKGYPSLFDDFLELFPCKILARDLGKAYNAYDCKTLETAPSLRDMMENLVKQNKRLFIFTNGHKERQLRKIEKLGIKPLLSGIYVAGPEEPETLLKPNPSGFFSFHKKFLFDTPVMVGDDILIDKGFSDNAGIPFIHFHFGKTNI